MTRTGQAAIDYARARVGGPGSMPDSGLCLQFVRTCFEVPSYYYSAIDAGRAAQLPHPGDRNPPPAVPLWFASPSPYDHVVFCCSTGELISTWNDEVRTYPSIDAVEVAFDAAYLGWSEDINRVQVWTGEDDDDMPSIEEIRSAVADETAKVMRGAEFNLGAGSLEPRVAGTVWNTVLSGLNPYNGTTWTAPASTFLLDARGDSQPDYVAARVWSSEPATRTSGVTLLALALVVAVIIGLLTAALSSDVVLGAYTGGAAAINGVVAVIAAVVGRRSAHHA